MSAVTPTAASGSTEPSSFSGHDDQGSGGAVDKIYGFLRRIPTGLLWLIVLVWLIPTLGLFINSFRDRTAQRVQIVVSCALLICRSLRNGAP